jgi:hypothetical protein
VPTPFWGGIVQLIETRYIARVIADEIVLPNVTALGYYKYLTIGEEYGN